MKNNVKYNNPYEKLRVQFVKGMNEKNYPSKWDYNNAKDWVIHLFDYPFALLLEGIE